MIKVDMVLNIILDQNMKKILIILFVYCLSNISFGRSLMIKRVEELVNDISARVDLRVDENDAPCAMLRLNLPSVEKLFFGNMVVGDVKYLPGEYVLYIRPNSQIFSFSFDDKEISVDFAEYGIEIEGKKSYRIILKDESKDNATSSTQAFITANYDDVVVLVDGVPVGETPVLIESIDSGRHTLSVPFQKGIGMNDTVINIVADIKNNIRLTLNEMILPSFDIDMAIMEGYSEGLWGYHIKKENNKFGITDYNGKTLLPCEYDECSEFPIFDTYHVVGIRNPNEDSPNTEVNYSPNKVNMFLGIFSPFKGWLLPCEYDVIWGYNDIIKIGKNGKIGLMNKDGSLIMPMIDGSILSFSDGEAVIVRNSPNGGENQWEYYLYDYINHKPLTSPEPYHKNIRLYPINEGYLPYAKTTFNPNTGRTQEYGILDKNGNKTLLPAGYELLDNLGAKVNSGLFPVVEKKDRRKMGFMNTKMELVVPMLYNNKYSDGSTFETGVAEVFKDIPNRFVPNKCIIDRTGKILFDKEKMNLSKIELYRDETIRVESNDGTVGLYSIDGSTIIPEGKYVSIGLLGDNKKNYYTCVKNSGETVILDKDLNEMFLIPETVSIMGYDNGMFLYMDNVHDVEAMEPYGFLNEEGEIIASGLHSNLNTEEGYMYLNEIQYNRFSDGLAIYNIGNMYGYINNKGDVVVPLIYTAITPFVEGVCFARDREGKWSRIFRKDL